MQTFTDLYRYRFVLSNLVGKNLKVMYRSMSLGMLWTLLNPLVMVVTLTLVWVVAFGAKLEFAAMIIVVLIPYNFSAYCLTGCVHAIPGNAALVKKSSFPRQVLPISIVATHLIHFAIQSILIIAIVTAFPLEGGYLGWHLLWLLPVFFVQLCLCIGVGMLVAGLNVLYRDVQYIAESLLTVLFWVCPIIYTDATLRKNLIAEVKDGVVIEKGHEWAYHVYYANPLSGILTVYRDVLFYGTAPTVWPFGQAVIGTLVLGILGVFCFWRYEKEFADLV